MNSQKNKIQDYCKKIIDLSILFSGKLGLSLPYLKNSDELIDGCANYISSKFFGNDKKQIIESDIKNTLDLINHTLQNLKEIRKEVEQDNEIEIFLKQIIKNSIYDLLYKLIILKKAIYFELEKFSFDFMETKDGFSISKNMQKASAIGLDTKFEKTKQIYLRQIEKIQTILYGPRISDSEWESELVIMMLLKLFNSKKNLLNENERDLFSIFLNKFIKSIDVNGSLNINAKQIKIAGKIGINDFKKISEFIIHEFYGLKNRIVKIEKGRKNMQIAHLKKTLILPDDEYMSESSLFVLIEHEIGGHLIRGENTHNTILVDGANYEDMDEGITKLNEELIINDTGSVKPEPGIAHISTFIGENYDFKGTAKLLKIYFKLQGNSDEESNKLGFNRALRVKSYYPFDMPGSNRKDVIYYRGLKSIINHLKTLDDNGKSKFYKDVYFSKLSLEDIKIVDELKQELGIDESELKYPVWIGKILYKKLMGGKGIFNNLEENLYKGDFRFTGTEKLTVENKRKLIQVLDMMGYHMKNGKYEKKETEDTKIKNQ